VSLGVVLNVICWWIRVWFSTIGEEEEEEVKARWHYEAAKVEEIIYNLGDDVYVRVCSVSTPDIIAIMFLTV
jgi:hypothetical protein